MQLGDQSGAFSYAGSPPPLQGLLCTRTHLFLFLIPQQTSCEGQSFFFPSSTYPQTPLSTQEGRVFNQRLKWNLPLGALGRVPLGQRPPSGGQHPGGGGGSASSQGTFCPWRRPANQVCGGKMLSAFQGGRCGSGEQDGRGTATTGGHSELTDRASPGKFGRVRRLTGFLPPKSVPGSPEQPRFSPELVKPRG